MDTYIAVFLIGKIVARLLLLQTEQLEFLSSVVQPWDLLSKSCNTRRDWYRYKMVMVGSLSLCLWRKQLGTYSRKSFPENIFCLDIRGYCGLPMTRNGWYKKILSLTDIQRILVCLFCWLMALVDLYQIFVDALFSPLLNLRTIFSGFPIVSMHFKCHSTTLR